MRRHVFLLFLSGSILLAPLPSAHAEDTTLQYKYLKVYLKINDADQLERNGDLRGALDDFKQCYVQLQSIHETDSNWESALVIHRMNDCRAKIVDLSNRLADSGNQVAPTPTPAAENGNTEAVPSPNTMEDITSL